MFQPILLYVALCALMFLFFSVRVVQGRVAFKISTGDGGNAEMRRRIRVHSNFAEYVPLALILLYAVQQGGFNVWVVHALGVVLIVARLFHAAGLAKTTGVSRGRLVGASGTFAVLFFGGVLTLLGAFGIHF